MINHVAIFWPNGTAFKELSVGVDDITNLFFDKENKECLVVVSKDEIVEYRGFLFVCLRGRKSIEA